MKNYIAVSMVATGLILFVFGFEMSAQTPDRLVADIPFEFYVRDEKLPAGRYEFERSTRLTFPAPLVVRSVNGLARRSMLVPTLAGRASLKSGGGPGITFKRYGSVFFLSGIDLPGEALALKISTTSTEREYARRGTTNPPVTIRPTVSRR